MNLSKFKLMLALSGLFCVSCYKVSSSSQAKSQRNAGESNSGAGGETASSLNRTDLYYYGEGRIVSLFDGSRSTETILLKKSTIPSENLISEIACVVKPDGKTILSPVYLRVDAATNSFQISTSLDAAAPSNLSGTGTLQGEPWNWKTLRFDMVMNTPRGNVTIKDSNWVVGDKLIARKEILLSNGMPVQLWETEAQVITQAEFEKRRAELACPTFP